MENNMSKDWSESDGRAKIREANKKLHDLADENSFVDVVVDDSTMTGKVVNK
jgi:hypothetical protein